MAMHSYYRQGFGKAPSERTKEAQALSIYPSNVNNKLLTVATETGSLLLF